MGGAARGRRGLFQGEEPPWSGGALHAPSWPGAAGCVAEGCYHTLTPCLGAPENAQNETHGVRHGVRKVRGSTRNGTHGMHGVCGVGNWHGMYKAQGAHGQCAYILNRPSPSQIVQRTQPYATGPQTVCVSSPPSMQFHCIHAQLARRAHPHTAQLHIGAQYLHRGWACKVQGRQLLVRTSYKW